MLFKEAFEFVVNNSAGRAFNSYMGGSNEYYRYMGLTQDVVDLLSLIYGRKQDDIVRQADKAIKVRFDQLVAIQCNKHRVHEGQ